MSNLKVVSDDEEFKALLDAAGDDLVIIDFYTSWCRPCRTMEPVFEAMALHYPKALFLKVDADKCFDTAMGFKVSGVPFFVIYFNKSVVETIQGANPQELELKIRLAEIESRKAYAAVEQTSNMNTRFASHVNPVVSTYGKLGSVAPYIDSDNSHCLNDLSPTSFHNFIGGKKLVSGRGTGKILLVYSFTQKMMLQSFKIKANPQTGPRVLRFFVNHPKVLDFNVGSTLAPSQEVTLSHHDLTGDRAIELRSGSFQVVTNVQIFVVSGQSKNSRIEIDTMQLYGAPVLAIQPLLAVDSLMKPMNNNVARAMLSEHGQVKPKCDNDSCHVPVMVPHASDDDEDNESVLSRSSKSQGSELASPGPVTAYHHTGHRHHHHHHHGHHRSQSENNNDQPSAPSHENDNQNDTHSPDGEQKRHGSGNSGQSSVNSDGKRHSTRKKENDHHNNKEHHQFRHHH